MLSHCMLESVRKYVLCYINFYKPIDIIEIADISMNFPLTSPFQMNTKWSWQTQCQWMIYHYSYYTGASIQSSLNIGTGLFIMGQSADCNWSRRPARGQGRITWSVRRLRLISLSLSDSWMPVVNKRQPRSTATSYWKCTGKQSNKKINKCRTNLSMSTFLWMWTKCSI